MKYFKYLNKYILLLILSMFISTFSFSQTKEELEKEKDKIENELRYTNSLLEETMSGKKTSLNQLHIINKKINTRKKLIKNINNEIKYIDNSILTTQDSIVILQNTLEILKDEYAKMILNTWHNKNTYKRLSYIFASKDLNQAFKRIAYFKYYSNKRKQYSNEIIEITEILQNKNKSLEAQRVNKQELAKSKEQETNKLNSEKNVQNKKVQELTQKEKNLKKKIKAQQNALNKLRASIEKIIADEKRSRSSSGRLELTPEEKLISGKFEGNKGKLPWPTERGIIVETFGEHPHPQLKRITIKSNGIDILTESHSKARAIFDGTVTNIMKIPQYNNVVIIRHGEYLTVYSNLSDIYVNVGQKVKTKQPIGLIYSDPTEGITKMHFEVWKDNVIQNPEHWISK